ncbi:hypothetical protein HOY80DRAFT_1094218 [Tuber brumale]|nr:hypothetical protein HOY80DRAFT_1094218 [Tuber brumale]
MPLFRSAVWVLKVLVSFTSIVHTRDFDPTKNFSELSGHMGTAPSKLLNCPIPLFADQRSGYIVAQKDSILRSLNVSKSFKTSPDDTSYIRTERFQGAAPNAADAAFFPTESGFNLTFGKWYPSSGTIYGNEDSPIQNWKWEYEIATQQWTSRDITPRDWLQKNSSRRVFSSMTAWIPSLKKGFLFGGYFVSVNEESLEMEALEAHDGLITYDQATDMWTDETALVGGISDGGLVHITTATDEVLIQLGGRTEGDPFLRPFSEINIYSTKRSKWYTQHLPSDALVPGPRSSFCTAVKSASDGSSYQIYIMGGYEGLTPESDKEGLTLKSVWVLSIPLFEWAKLSVSSIAIAGEPKRWISPKCLAIGEHYIFYYGGRRAQETYDNVNAAFLFDVNNSSWTDVFTPNEGMYEIPPKVIGLIGGDKNGGSTKKAPANGWSNPDLESIMGLKIWNRGPRGSIPRFRSNKPKPNGREIAEGAVAGVAAVALGLLGWMAFLRYRQWRISQLPQVNGTGVTLILLPTACAGTLEEGNSPAELMAHNQANGRVMRVAELPSLDVAREMDTGIRIS